MFRSLGNVLVNPRVGMLFLDFEQPRRLRVNGLATLLEDVAGFEGAQLVVRVARRGDLPQLPALHPSLRLVETSQYAPRPGTSPRSPTGRRTSATFCPQHEARLTTGPRILQA